MATDSKPLDSAIERSKEEVMNPPLGASQETPQGTPQAPQAEQAPGQAQPGQGDAQPESDSSPHKKLMGKGFLRGSGAGVFSLLVHAVVLIALGLIALPELVDIELIPIVAEMFDEQEEELTVELEESIEPATEVTTETLSAAPMVGAAGEALGSMSQVEVSTEITEVDTTALAVNAPTLLMPSTKLLIAAVPKGTLGEARSVVDGYSQAMDRITREIMWMLDKGKVLVVWAFDESGSMKDDQKEIAQRVNRVYVELGIVDKASGDALHTAVTSYGGQFHVHLEKPTADLSRIRKAIERVPVDASGKEMMCEAVGYSIAQYRDYARKSRRQMVLILVTDESGEPKNNNRHLENAISEAKSAGCRIYTMGREAVFGYPYVFMHWRHPQTRRMHWLPVNRGPETAFVEQLQTNGLWRRYDAFSSGFGPYEQARMSRETGGIFFMLPSVESKLVRRQDKRRYELEMMRAYHPDLRTRQQALDERKKYPLRALIWRVISDLNPYNEENKKVVVVRHDFSLNPTEFVTQARENQAKAKLLIGYMAAAEKMMKEGERLRKDEADPRWQANYDLIYAQLIAYQARLYEYGVGLEAFIKNPKTAPLKKDKLVLIDWDIRTRHQLLAEEKSKPYAERSTALFREVIKNHPGTPWAERAKWEINRGFGIHLAPDYDEAWVKFPNAIPIPKL